MSICGLSAVFFTASCRVLTQSASLCPLVPHMWTLDSCGFPSGPVRWIVVSKLWASQSWAKLPAPAAAVGVLDRGAAPLASADETSSTMPPTILKLPLMPSTVVPPE